MRRLVVGVAIAATTALVLPASASAQTPPKASQEHDFQLPSIPGLFPSGRQCGAGMLASEVVPGHASTDSAGNTTFSQTFRYVGDLGGPTLGSSTVRWFNLASFRGGVASFTLTDHPEPIYDTSGEVSVKTGTGPVVALMQPDTSFAAEHCSWTPSLGFFSA
ncbi:MAG: hypothetical protein ABI251_09525 [Mycobacteriaceae bacterium]